jgi:hypothetical protein
MKLHRSDDINLGVTLCPRLRDGELFGVHRISTGSFEGIHAPLDSFLHRGRAGNAATNFIGQNTQVLL